MSDVFSIEDFTASGKTMSVQYRGSGDKWVNPNEAYKATHYLYNRENLTRKIAINRFNDTGDSSDGGHNFLVYVLDEEIHQVVNLLKLLRSGGSNE